MTDIDAKMEKWIEEQWEWREEHGKEMYFPDGARAMYQHMKPVIEACKFYSSDDYIYFVSKIDKDGVHSAIIEDGPDRAQQALESLGLGDEDE